MKDNQLLRDIKDLLNIQRFCVVATTFEGHPYMNLVSYANTDDLHTILFATLRNTRKYKNIILDPRTSILVDNRKNSPNDLKEAVTVTALGKSKEVDFDKEKKIGAYLNRHPYMREFISNPNCALIEVNVEKYIYVSKFQDVKVIELDIDRKTNN
jgi:general stress protein 26